LAYIGTIPAEAYTSFAVQHFTTSATDTFTLDFPVANENEIALFINNVRQEPGSSYAYTASGTTLTLSSAITGSDSMYCVFIGKAVQTVTPASGSVTNDMLAGSIATSKLADGSTFATTNGITMVDKFVLTSSKTGGGDITANLARESSNNYGGIGSTMTESSGIFTFPSTGVYLITFQGIISMPSANSRYNELQINTSIDSGSNYNTASNSNGSIPTGYAANSGVLEGFCLAIFDVTNISTHQVKFSTAFESGSAVLASSFNQTSMTFIRLGDT